MSKSLTSFPTIYPEDIAQKGREIYQKLSQKLEENDKGKFVAIEVDSGKYFVGETQEEALKKAKQHFPARIFYFVKVGFPAVVSVSTHHRPHINIFFCQQMC